MSSNRFDLIAGWLAGWLASWLAKCYLATRIYDIYDWYQFDINNNLIQTIVTIAWSLVVPHSVFFATTARAAAVVVVGFLSILFVVFLFLGSKNVIHLVWL